MRKLQYLFYAIPVLFFVGVAQADDQKDAEAAFDALIAAWNAGDIDAAVKHYAPDVTFFWPNGNLLEKADFEGGRAFLASGGKIDVRYSHEDITVYGNSAILTGYEQRSFTPPEGQSSTETLRSTVNLAKQQGQWKIVHVHLSYLTPENPE